MDFEIFSNKLTNYFKERSKLFNPNELNFYMFALPNEMNFKDF